MGVRRAMEIVLAEVNKGTTPLYTYGPLIHNKEVLVLLAAKGVKGVDDVTGLTEGTIVIRAHGISPEERNCIKATGLRIKDATCPRVAQVQAIIGTHSRRGYHAIIVGDKDHPEVKGLLGYAAGRGYAVNTALEVEQLPHMDKVVVVAQTTQSEGAFREVVAAIRRRFRDPLVFDTICEATSRRQREALELAFQVNGMVVVGGLESGNTRRLVEVCRSTGVPTFHVETEEEIPRQELEGMGVVGVTAGASTPNWLIRSVVRGIEEIPGRSEWAVGRWLVRMGRSLLLSNAVVAGGAFCLAYAAALLSGREADLIYPALAFLYVYAMHVLNRFLDKGASAYSDPEVASFYKRHRGLLVTSGVAAIIASLILSLARGPWVFLTMAVLNLLGVLYSIPLVPPRIRHLWDYTRIKDIPGSKTLAVAMAWGTAIVVLPVVGGDASGIPVVVAFTFVFCSAYVRSALFDIFQQQGDLIVGVETLPITLGEERTMRLLKGVSLFAGGVMMVAPLLGACSGFAYLLILCVISLFFLLLAYERRWLLPGRRFEALVEGNLYLAGVLALIWQLAFATA